MYGSAHTYVYVSLVCAQAGANQSKFWSQFTPKTLNLIQIYSHMGGADSETLRNIAGGLGRFEIKYESHELNRLRHDKVPANLLEVLREC